MTCIKNRFVRSDSDHFYIRYSCLPFTLELLNLIIRKDTAKDIIKTSRKIDRNESSALRIL